MDRSGVLAAERICFRKKTLSTLCRRPSRLESGLTKGPFKHYICEAE
jgi:hypothetical protein